MLTQFSFYGMLLLQQEVGFDMVSMWNQMGFAARAVVMQTPGPGSSRPIKDLDRK